MESSYTTNSYYDGIPRETTPRTSACQFCCPWALKTNNHGTLFLCAGRTSYNLVLLSIGLMPCRGSHCQTGTGKGVLNIHEYNCVTRLQARVHVTDVTNNFRYVLIGFFRSSRHRILSSEVLFLSPIF